uniref:Uncharacterized protein n=1 Tax=Timema cristinae TaxID=61476 RepID=A0A7R9D1Y5_TIMCR|nr:unnamed protein product [Timema cristinae]
MAAALGAMLQLAGLLACVVLQPVRTYIEKGLLDELQSQKSFYEAVIDKFIQKGILDHSSIFFSQAVFCVCPVSKEVAINKQVSISEWEGTTNKISQYLENLNEWSVTNRVRFPAGESECGHVFLTLSSLWHLSTHDRGLVDREIELNWETTGCEEELPPEWVELFNTDPHTNTHSDRPVSLLRVKPSDYPDGFYKTNLSLGRPPYPGGWSKDEGAGVKEEGSHCFPYWIASFRNSILLHSDCLKIRPTWMGDNRQQLGSVPLVSLFIPGTHNSGSHQRGATLTRRDTLAGYLLTQDTDVWGQLVHGIRYLDLRVGYYPPSANKTRNQNHSTLDHVNTEAESTWLWPPLKQLWGDEQTVDGLQEYLSRAMDAGVTGLWAAMAELTPTPLDIMFKPSGSLRHMADSVNRNITAWFRHRWWQHANIVATDYFLGNGIIDVAVSANLRRGDLLLTRLVHYQSSCRYQVLSGQWMMLVLVKLGTFKCMRAKNAAGIALNKLCTARSL